MSTIANFRDFLFLLESTELSEKYIIENDKRAFVGVDHGITPSLPNDVVKKIKTIGDKYGYWYEGGGGDKEVVKLLFGNVEYKGSWDAKISDLKPQNPSVYVYTLFSNIKENDTIEKVMKGKGDTVFQKALSSYKTWAHDMIVNKSEKEFKTLLTKFIKHLGENYYEDSQMKGTLENVRSFLSSVEDDMWDNWPEGNGPAFEMAYAANIERDANLVNSIREGVFFTGMGHIVLLKKLLTQNKPKQVS